jgi:hypothetical protein
MSQALQTTKPNTDVISRITEFQSVAKVFSESGLFTDVKGQSQCFVKIMAGAELGIPPFTAMNSFHIIKGKVTMTANTIAARVKASGRYNFRVVEKTADKCVIEFSEDGKPVYTETWDAKRARQAGTQNMDRFPDAMLFARCITSGARAVCPDVVGQFYTPEEMGAKVNEDGEVIQGESRQVETVIADVVVEKAKQLGGVVRTDTPELAPTDWKDQIKALGVASNKYLADADIGLAADISAAQSAARALLTKTGVTKDEFNTVANDLQSVIDRADDMAHALPA